MENRAWIYSRIAGEPDDFLELQTVELRQYAAENGLEVVGVSQECFSGRVMDRPGLKEIEQAAKQQKMDILLVVSTSRISRNRNLADWVIGIIDCGVEVRAIRDGLTFNKKHRPWNGSVCYCRVGTEQQLL